MDFSYSEEQVLLRDMAGKLVADRYGFEARRAILKSEDGFSRALWSEMAELGLTGLNVPEAFGGLGAGPVETSLAMEAFGRALVVEPFLPSAVLSTALLTLAPETAPRAALLSALTSGKTIIASALYERRGRFELDHVETRAARSGAQVVLSGEKTGVLGGGAADGYLVSARSGAGRDTAPIALYYVPRQTKGLTVLAARAIDNTSIATLNFDDVTLDIAAALIADNTLPIVEQSIDIATSALTAEALGVMRAAIDLTTDYLRMRKQFGQPLGKFQVLQHACADMFVASEEAASASLLAAARCTHADPRERRRAVSAAKVTINKAARFIGQSAVQLHGGIAMTEEAAVSHYFRRLTAIENTFGDTDHHLAAFAALG
jgi:alkylation response protein AidB-like acyl-CoA dehydrogenase